MIQLVNLTKRYGSRVLFDEVNATFSENQRVGLVGANGAGKSTLLGIIAGSEPATSGKVEQPSSSRIGTLKQDHYAYEDCRIMDVVLMGRETLWSVLEERAALFEEADLTDEQGMRLAELEHEVAELDGYSAEAEAGILLDGLGIPSHKHDDTMKTLSGGFKLRVLLAQLLFSKPDVLLLDEPTNHLDILSIRWLENFLIQQQWTVLIVSHDRDFLNGICTHIADIDYGTMTMYTGNFDYFLASKALKAEQLEKESINKQKKVEQLQQFIDRFGAKNTKATQAKSKAKEIARIGSVDLLVSSRRAPKFQFKQQNPSGKTVVKLEDIGKSFGDLHVLHGVTFDVHRQEKVAVLGPNGVGKSTLLKVMTGLHDADDGQVEWGPNVAYKLFAQDHHEQLPGDSSPLEWLWSFQPSEDESKIRGVLGMMLFSGDDVKKSISALSGGEAARLIMASFMLMQPNVLILDEPTNHLDLESIAALANALRDFAGTVICVSHDRSFVRSMATRILEVTPGRVNAFQGTYDEWVDWSGRDHIDRDGVNLRAARKKAPKKADANLDKEERKTLRKEETKLRKQRETMEQDIDSLEKSIKAIDGQLNNTGYTASAPAEELQQLAERKENVERELEELMARWEAVTKEHQTVADQLGLEVGA